MKRFTIGLFLIFVFYCISGCSITKNRMNKKIIKLENILTYEIYDTDRIVESRQNGKIYIHTVKVPLKKLRTFEEKSYSKKFLNVAGKSDEEIYERIDKYLSSYDFSSEEYALYNNRFDFVDKIGVIHKRFDNHPIINSGKIIGESIYVDNVFHCFSYVFLYISKNYLITTKIELYKINPSILENENTYFERKNNDDFSYGWISEAKRKEFYAILESDEYKKLPEEFQLLRESKDLFLNSLKITDDMG